MTAPSLAEDGIIQNSDGTLTLVRIVPQTTAVGYGVDLKCIDDLDPALADVDPFSRDGLAQDLYHRVTTRRGTLPDDPDYGIDVFAFLHGPKTPVDLRACEGQIATEIQKDDRVTDVSVAVAFSLATNKMTITVVVVPQDPDIGPFSLIIAVTDGGALLAAIES